MEDFLKASINIVIFLFAVLANPANASFIGTYDFVNWTKTINGGLISTDALTDSVTLVSSDKGSGGKNQDFTINATTAGLVSFNWSYLTADTSKNDKPKFDRFGWLLNGAFTQLTADKGATNQSGSVSFQVKLGDIFGFEAQSLNSRNGAATTKITNFSGPVPAAVPLPASAWLMVAPMIALLRKRKVNTV
jgi:hypothetical protein